MTEEEEQQLRELRAEVRARTEAKIEQLVAYLGLTWTDCPKAGTYCMDGEYFDGGACDTCGGVGKVLRERHDRKGQVPADIYETQGPPDPEGRVRRIVREDRNKSV